MAKKRHLFALVLLLCGSHVATLARGETMDASGVANRFFVVGVISGASTKGKDTSVAVVKDKQLTRSILLREGDFLPYSDQWKIKFIEAGHVTVGTPAVEIVLLPYLGGSDESLTSTQWQHPLPSNEDFGKLFLRDHQALREGEDFEKNPEPSDLSVIAPEIPSTRFDLPPQPPNVSENDQFEHHSDDQELQNENAADDDEWNENSASDEDFSDPGPMKAAEDEAGSEQPY